VDLSGLAAELEGRAGPVDRGTAAGG